MAAIGLFKQSLDVLAWYLREVRPALVRAHSDDAIFLTVRGDRVPAGWISSIFARYRDMLGLSRDLTAHCLRHTFETKLHEAGLDLATLAYLMGHDDERTTLIYDHLGDPVMRAHILEFQRTVLDQSRLAA